MELATGHGHCWRPHSLVRHDQQGGTIKDQLDGQQLPRGWTKYLNGHRRWTDEDRKIGREQGSNFDMRKYSYDEGFD